MISSSARQFLVLGLVTSLAACGGKSSSTTTTPPGGEEEKVAGDASPFDQEMVQQTLAASPIPESCGGTEAGNSLGTLFAEQQQNLGEPTEVDFACTKADGVTWDCTWSVFSVPTGPADPEDPCAGEGGSGYQIMVKVDDAGALQAGSVFCNAPG